MSPGTWVKLQASWSGIDVLYLVFPRDHRGRGALWDDVGATDEREASLEAFARACLRGTRHRVGNTEDTVQCSTGRQR